MPRKPTWDDPAIDAAIDDEAIRAEMDSLPVVVIEDDPVWTGDDYCEPLHVHGPPEGCAVFGSQVGWDRAREPDSWPAGQLCPTCGSDGYYPLDGDGNTIPDPQDPDRVLYLPGLINPGSSLVCMTCMRWGHDGRLAAMVVQEYHDRGTNDPVRVEPPVALPEPESRGNIPIAHFVADAETGTLVRVA